MRKLVMEVVKDRNELSSDKIIGFEVIEEQDLYYILMSFKNKIYVYETVLAKTKKDTYKIYQKKMTIEDLKTIYRDIDIIKLIDSENIKYNINEFDEICFNKNVGECNKFVDILNGIQMIKNLED